MAIAPTPPALDLDDRPVPDRDAWIEVVDGRLREKSRKGAQVDRVVVDLIGMIHSQFRRLGLCFSGNCAYQGIFAHDPGRIRYPDLSFVRSGRLLNDKPPRGSMSIVPDLIVEVVSPRDNAENVDQRLMDFLQAGVRLAWLIDPTTRQVSVFRQGTDALRLGEGDVLDGEDVLPGFACPLNDLFAEI